MKHINLNIAALFLMMIVIVSLWSCNIESKSNTRELNTNNWFHSYDFDASTLNNVPKEYGPYTRWWWPGNDVTKEGLEREIKLLASNGFAGVEIQPLTYGLNLDGPKEQLERQFSWDSPKFYGHLKFAIEQAKKYGLTVDLTAGSGWPMGGPNVTPDISLQTLAYADTSILGGREINIKIPCLYSDSLLAKTKRDGLMLFKPIDISYAKLQAVIAGKYIKKEANQTFLEENSLIDISENVSNGILNWQAPAGEWIILTFWSLPDGELTKGMAAKPNGLVIDHLDSTKLQIYYQHLFGERTGLTHFFGHPVRAVFNDSYEFLPDRHFSDDFINYFSQQRGYSIVPYLPANMQKGYNSAYGPVLSPGQKPYFVLGSEDWRLRYDYDLTVSELIKNQFIGTSNNWLVSKGLLHRTQAYGAKMDIIGNSGKADIPETEQLAGNNSEGFIKLITSGAHLYNKPIVTQESFVFIDFAETTTPQKIKISADKSFASGVNQIIYHGTPYKYQIDDYGKEGWSPFSSPYFPLNFSSTINESFPYWKDIKQINEYISRVQYALQSGDSKCDLLIYFPFIDFYPEQIVNNPEEVLHSGFFKGVEPDMRSYTVKTHTNLASDWYKKLWPLVNKLEANGITWEFVNDDALQKAHMKDNEIIINGNGYQAIVIANAPYIQLNSAKNINSLSKDNSKILIFGDKPEKQPSYLNWKFNDKTVITLIEEALVQENVAQLKDEKDLDGWINTLSIPVRYRGNYNFARQIVREMADGSRLHFIWNKSEEWQRVSFLVGDEYRFSYFINPENTITSENINGSGSYNIPPWGTVFLYACKRKLADSLISIPAINTSVANKVLTIENWNIKSGDISLNNTKLFDWRKDDQFKYKSGEATYASTFEIDKKEGKKYYLELGEVFFTSDVFINGIHAGKRIWAPFELDVTDLIKKGENSIEVRIIPTNRNSFIREAESGNRHYQQFKNLESSVMPAGLVGPVIIKAI